MLEKPAIPDELIISGVQQHYHLQPTQLAFLPLGYDTHTAVYRFTVPDGRAYFLKLRSGDFDPVCVTVPDMLTAQSVHSIIPPLATKNHQLVGSLGEYMLILYPFIEGLDGYEVELTEQQWLDFGAALKAIHAVRITPEIEPLLPQETYSERWRAVVNKFQAEVEHNHASEPVAKKLAAFMREKRRNIRQVVDRAEALSRNLRKQSLELVLCHGDIHPGNLQITADQGIYIVDWDGPLLAPKEKDLALIGGCLTWSSPRSEALFYRGYGAVEAVNQIALAYYRYERIVQDIAEFCMQILVSDEGGEDREQSYEFFTGLFVRGHEIELADQILLAASDDLRQDEPPDQPTP